MVIVWVPLHFSGFSGQGIAGLRGRALRVTGYKGAGPAHPEKVTWLGLESLNTTWVLLTYCIHLMLGRFL